MASDEDYTAFLEKANQTTSSTANTQSSSHSKSLTTNTVNTTVPTTLNKIEAYYTSDTDERFEPVALQYAGGELDKALLGKLLNFSGTITEESMKEWNVKDRYNEIIEAVRHVSIDKVVKVFRLDNGTTRSEYFVLSVSEASSIVGYKVKAVES